MRAALALLFIVLTFTAAPARAGLIVSDDVRDPSCSSLQQVQYNFTQPLTGSCTTSTTYGHLWGYQADLNTSVSASCAQSGYSGISGSADIPSFFGTGVTVTNNVPTDNFGRYGVNDLSDFFAQYCAVPARRDALNRLTSSFSIRNVPGDPGTFTATTQVIRDTTTGRVIGTATSLVYSQDYQTYGPPNVVTLSNQLDAILRWRATTLARSQLQLQTNINNACGGLGAPTVNVNAGSFGSTASNTNFGGFGIATLSFFFSQYCSVPGRMTALRSLINNIQIINSPGTPTPGFTGLVVPPFTGNLTFTYDFDAPTPPDYNDFFRDIDAIMAWTDPTLTANQATLNTNLNTSCGLPTTIATVNQWSLQDPASIAAFPTGGLADISSYFSDFCSVALQATDMQTNVTSLQLIHDASATPGFTFVAGVLTYTGNLTTNSMMANQTTLDAQLNTLLP